MTTTNTTTQALLMDYDTHELIGSATIGQVEQQLVDELAPFRIDTDGNPVDPSEWAASQPGARTVFVLGDADWLATLLEN